MKMQNFSVYMVLSIKIRISKETSLVLVRFKFYVTHTNLFDLVTDPGYYRFSKYNFGH